MFFIYFLAFFAFIPILAYLLSQNTNNKGYIFGISFLVIIFCLFTVVGKYSFLGSIQKQKINSEILMNISADKKISENTLQGLSLAARARSPQVRHLPVPTVSLHTHHFHTFRRPEKLRLDLFDHPIPPFTTYLPRTR